MDTVGIRPEAAENLDKDGTIISENGIVKKTKINFLKIQFQFYFSKFKK